MSSDTSPDTPEFISGVSAVIDRYDAFVVDLWGVLHDGVRAFPSALDVLERLKASGKAVAILSNAPRRASAVAARNAELGIGPAHYDVVHCSGEDCWQHLKERPDAFYRDLGRRCFHIGPERDRGLREGLDYDFVEAVEDADFLLNTGADKADDRPEDFDSILRPAQARGLPMICANPDRVVIRGGKREICAGAIADRFEELGGAVRWHGKPHASVFEASLSLLGKTDPSAALMIGDSLITDIAGANAAGLDSLLVTGGILAEALGVAPDEPPTKDRLASLCAEIGHQPGMAIPALRW